MERIHFAATSRWVLFNKLLTHKYRFGILDSGKKQAPIFCFDIFDFEKTNSYLLDRFSTGENSVACDGRAR
jgi:hypothetical protein